MSQPAQPSLVMNPSLEKSIVEPVLEKQYASNSESPNPERVAVIVNHGMGQQVPFETLELVAEAVWRAAKMPITDKTEQDPKDRTKPFTTGAKEPPSHPAIRAVRLGTQGKDEVETELRRVEMTFKDANDKTHEVHFYEAYWAPLTEGQVNLRETVSFLFGGGWDGLRNCEVGYFHRWMFGQLQKFKFRRYTKVLLLLLIILLLGSLVIINAVIAAAAVSHAIGGNDAFPRRNLLAALTSDLIVGDMAALLVFLGVFAIPRSYKLIAKRPIVPRWLSLMEWLFVGAGFLPLLLVGYVMALGLMGQSLESYLWHPLLTWVASIIVSPSSWATLFTLLVWGLAVVAAAGARWALVEYGGDVAVYIAAHTVSKFWHLRQQIWQTAMKVTRAVYRTQTTENDGTFYYPRVIMVGHSLGSVIAYDVLNGMLLEEEFSKQPLDIARRTRMFVTFGSPLDKTAFIFRTQADADSEIREVAAAAVQPMISSYDRRPQEWVNLYSNADIFDSRLKFYDASPANQNPNDASKRVKNKKDPEARTPLVAHIEYWHGDLFAATLYRGITTQPPKSAAS